MQSLAWQRFMLGFSEFNAQFDCITNLKSVFPPVLHSEYFFAVTKELIDLREKAVYGKIIFLNKDTYLKQFKVLYVQIKDFRVRLLDFRVEPVDIICTADTTSVCFKKNSWSVFSILFYIFQNLARAEMQKLQKA